MKTTTHAHQNDTLDAASKNGDHWTIDEIDFVRAFDATCTDTEIAIALNRTLYAIWAIKAIRIERRERVTPTHHALPIDAGVTDLNAWERSFDA